MTQIPQKTRVRRAEAPRTSGYKEFTNRNFTFVYSSDIRDWIKGKSIVTAKLPNKF